MNFPKKAIDDLTFCATTYAAVGTERYVSVDPKDLDDAILYSEISNARVKELEDLLHKTDVKLHEANIKLHMVRSAVG